MTLRYSARYRWIWLWIPVLLGMAACSSKPDSKALLARGKQLMTEGKQDEAALTFKKAIQADPENAEPLEALADTLMTPLKMQDAMLLLQKAATLAPNSVSVRVKLADSMLSLFLATRPRPEELRSQLETVLQELSRLNPQSEDLARLRAYLLMDDGQPGEAVRLLETTLAAQPNQERASLALSTALIQADREDEAEKVALEAITANKNFLPLYDLMIAQFGKQPTKIGRAEKFLRLKMEHQPQVVTWRLNLARFHRTQRNAAAMEETLKPLREDTKRFPRGALQAADFYVETQAYGPAAAALEAVIAARPDLKKEAQIRLATVLFFHNKRTEAWALADQLNRANPGDVDVLLLRSDMVETARSEERQEDLLNSLRDAVSTKPKDARLHFAIGRILRSRGDLTGAIQSFEESLKQNPAFVEARVAAVRLHLSEFSYVPALNHVKKLLEAEPQNPEYRLLRAICRRGQGNFIEARDELIELRSLFPNFNEVKVELANVELAEGRFRQAETSFRGLTDKGSSSFQQLSGLARALASQNELAKGLQILAGARGKFDDGLLDLEAAEICFLARDFLQAARYFASADRSGRLSAAALGRYAESEQANGQLERAISLAKRSLAIDPQRLQRQAFLASLLSASGQREEAKQLYRKVLAVQPSNHPIANNLAYLLAEDGQDLAEAERWATQSVREQPNNDGYSDTLGFVYLKQGKTDQAISLFQKAIQRLPDEGVFYYHLGLARQAKGDRQGAITAWQQAQKLKLDMSDRQAVERALNAYGK